MPKEQVVPGCQNEHSLSGVCEVEFQKGETTPSQAKKAETSSLSVIEGPEAKVCGLICLAHRKPNLQALCSHFTQRLNTKDAQELNL